MFDLARWIVVIVSAAVSLTACGVGYVTVYQPYPGTTPAVPLAQAKDICENRATLAKMQAQSNFDATNELSGFAAGYARSGAGRKAYSATFDGCMAEQGFQQTRVKRSEATD